MTSTIFALATAKGRAGVGIIRISGPMTLNILERIVDTKTLDRLIKEPRKLVVSNFYIGSTPSVQPCHGTLKRTPFRSNDLIDSGMAVFFPHPNSFTGEDVAELHIHSSTAVISAMYKAISNYDTSKVRSSRLVEGAARIAEPGEFIRRAFANGKVDLTQIEGIADLLEAETEAQRLLAIRQVDGQVSKAFQRWRHLIIETMADCEAWIDFSDEGQVDEDLLSTIDVKIKNIKDELHRELKSKSFEIVRSGLTVAIIGPPNAGKSSLLNFLVKRPASIVSPIKGTTRDVVQVTLDLQGIPVLLHDTAGIRKNSEDIVESEGISRAIKTARSANIILLLIPADELHLLDDWIHEFKLDFEKTFVFVTKTDLVSDESFTIPAELKICSFLKCGNNDYSPVENFLYNFVGNIDICMEQPAIVQERHRQLVTQSLRHLEEAQSHLNSEKIVISAAHLRRAANCIGQVTGHIDVEQVLDLIFSKFCIGK